MLLRRPATRKRITGLSDGIDIQIKSGLKKGERVRGPQIIADSSASDGQ